MINTNSFVSSNEITDYFLRTGIFGNVDSSLMKELDSRNEVFFWITGLLPVFELNSLFEITGKRELYLNGFFLLERKIIDSGNEFSTDLLIIPSKDFEANNEPYKKKLLIEDLHDFTPLLIKYFDESTQFDQYEEELFNLLHNFTNCQRFPRFLKYYHVNSIDRYLTDFGFDFDVVDFYDENKNIKTGRTKEIAETITTNNNTNKLEDLQISNEDNVKLIEAYSKDIHDNNSKDSKVKLRNLKIMNYALTELLGCYKEYQKGQNNLNVSAVADAIISFYDDRINETFDKKTPSKSIMTNNHSELKKEIEDLIQEAFNENHSNFSQK